MKNGSRASMLVTLLTVLGLLVCSTLSAAARVSPHLTQRSASTAPTEEADSTTDSEDDEQDEEDSGGWFENAMDTGGDIIGSAKDTTVDAAGTVWETAQDAPGAVWDVAEQAPGVVLGTVEDGWNWLRNASSRSVTWEGWTDFLIEHPVLGAILAPLVLLLIGLSPDGTISYLDIALSGLLLLIPAAKGIRVIGDVAASVLPRLPRGETIVTSMRRIPGLFRLDPVDMLAFLRARTIEPTIDSIAKLPTSPVVYVVMDANGTPIYVGMSKSIQRRLTEHFTPPKSNFADEASSIKIIPRGSSTDALNLECRLIKAFWPKYNIVHKNSALCPVYLEVVTPVQP